MIEKSKGLPADNIFLDLEDAVAASAKAEARVNAIAALRSDGWNGQIRTVRINDWSTPWTTEDVVSVVTSAGYNLDAVILPKVQKAEHVAALDMILTQLERAGDLPIGSIGIEVQIEDAVGLLAIDAIAKASARTESLIFGPGDFMASINMKSLVVGDQPAGYDVGDAYHHILMSILIAARANGLQAIDGPYFGVRDVASFERVARRSAALGFDGKWVIHPSQIDSGNEIFSPTQEDYDRAENILDASDFYSSAEGGMRGAATIGDEMIDEASRKMALVIAGKGRAAGMDRLDRWAPVG